MRAGPLIVLASLALTGCAVQADGFGPMPQPDSSGLYRDLQRDETRSHPTDRRPMDRNQRSGRTDHGR